MCGYRRNLYNNKAIATNSQWASGSKQLRKRLWVIVTFDSIESILNIAFLQMFISVYSRPLSPYYFPRIAIAFHNQ